MSIEPGLEDIMTNKKDNGPASRESAYEGDSKQTTRCIYKETGSLQISTSLWVEGRFFLGSVLRNGD